MSRAPKERLDQLLVERGLAPTREKAQAIILAGLVLVNDAPAEKAGAKYPNDVDVRLRGEPSRFVGRGGDKLDGALEHFGLDVTGVVALDVGASTGGFTHCLLERGAVRVYAVDVGQNQLDDRLRRDPRVVVLEKTHAKSLTGDMFSPPPTLAVIDVSFISAKIVLEHTLRALARPFRVIVLVKPQFEVGREQVGKGGVVREEAIQLEAVQSVREFGESLGLHVEGTVASQLRGGKKGNQEYFVSFSS